LLHTVTQSGTKIKGNSSRVERTKHETKPDPVRVWGEEGWWDGEGCVCLSPQLRGGRSKVGVGEKVGRPERGVGGNEKRKKRGGQGFLLRGGEGGAGGGGRVGGPSDGEVLTVGGRPFQRSKCIKGTIRGWGR